MSDKLRCAAVCLVGVLGIASIASAVSSLAAERGWLPVIALAGARDSERAIRTLRDVAQLWEIALQHTEMDDATRKFLDRTTDSLQDFNLARMYELLPEKDGKFRQLGVAAGISGQRYLITRRSDPGFEIGPKGMRQRMGDASLVLRAAPVRGRDGDTNYLLQGRVGIALAPIDWDMVVDAAQQLLLLLGSAADDASARPHAQIRQKVLTHNPKLRPEDVEPVATLWEAYPRLGDVISTLGSIDDLIAADAHGMPGVKRVHAVLHFDPKQMEARYPELADYLEDLDRLLAAELRWVDAHNRTFALVHIDSNTLTARVDFYEKDGLLLPSQADKPFVDQPIPAGVGVFPYRVLASANFRAFGVGIQMRNVRVELEHERTERGMELRGRLKQVPTVTVSGAALGFVPTGLIDAVIPGDIQGLAEKALTALCHGNGGKGTVLDARFDRRPGGVATLDGALTLEAIDSFLVKLGVGHFNSHVLPDDDVRADIKRVLHDAHRAFSADLEHYALAHAAKAP